MTNKLIETLKRVGLAEKEAEVYLASLSLGPATIQQIARAGELKRTSVYSLVESLKQKGLMREELKGWKTLYVAEEPERLEVMVERMRGEIRRSLPEFVSVYNLHTSGSFIKYYEGLESIKGVYENLLQDINPHEDYLVIGEINQWFAQDPKFFQDFLEKRAKLEINIRLLLQDSETAREHKRLERNYNEKVKILPTEMKLTTNMVIIPHRVVINQLTPPYLAMVIENDSVVQMNREMFEMIWRSLPEM